MEQVTAEKRTVFGKKLSGARKEGKLPAVLYGPKDESMPLFVDACTFKKTWESVGESTIISLALAGDIKEALIQHVALHPVTEEPVHADFYIFEKGKSIRVHVPLAFSGTAPAEKELGGTVIRVLHELEIEALPKDLPHSITVDVSPLSGLESQILVKDITMPAGVTSVTGGTEVVAAVSGPREEEEEEEAPADLSQIEVEKKGKQEEEGELKEGEKEEGKKEGKKE